MPLSKALKRPNFQDDGLRTGTSELGHANFFLFTSKACAVPVSTRHFGLVSQFSGAVRASSRSICSTRPTSRNAAALAGISRFSASLRAIVGALRAGLRVALGPVKPRPAAGLHLVDFGGLSARSHGADVPATFFWRYRYRCIFNTLSHEIPYGPALSRFNLLESQDNGPSNP
jgi:hypothetical protein